LKNLFAGVVILVILVITLTACSDDGTLYVRNVIPAEEECYRVYLSESGTTIEGYVIERPDNIRAGRRGTFVLKTQDGVATIPNFAMYVDATEKIDCSSLEYEQ